ncbi:MAG TPA: CoA-acylating methylmalonate-semialdehyde dehydrogenase [Pirellulaceae bacterium]
MNQCSSNNTAHGSASDYSRENRHDTIEVDGSLHAAENFAPLQSPSRYLAMSSLLDSPRTLEAPLFYGGQWARSPSSRGGEVHNPSTGEVIARVPFCGPEEVDQVVSAAAAAFASWHETPVIERARVMFRFHALMDRQLDDLARLITREHGKTFAEAQAEMKRGLEMVEFCCGIPSLLAGELFPNIAADVDGETARHAVGVCVGITPYNFPSMVPLWMFPVAITCGNTFVLKPSEKVPLSSLRLGELLVDAGLPPGVFNIVHGDQECVRALLEHPQVAAISFVGSTRVAEAIYTTGTRNGKRVQAAGGAKNHLIIMPDADVELAAKALSASAFGCAGQRCMAGSVAVPVGQIADPVVETLARYADSLSVGPSDGEAQYDMGPLINLDAVRRVEGYLESAASEGGRVVLDGRTKRSDTGFLIGPSVVDHVQPGARLAREEVFGPLLSVMRANDLDEAIALGASCPFGNGASIFTQDGRAAREFKRRFNAGMIGINVGVPAPMAWLPFTGWNQSFFGDLHMQGQEGIHFYTRQKMTLTRWFDSPKDSHHDPVWATRKTPPRP